MRTIHVVGQDAQYQYDEEGNIVTEWNDKACNWVIIPECEDAKLIYDVDANGITELPRAVKKADLPEGWESLPDYMLDIHYTDDEDGWPHHTTRSWGHLNWTREEAAERLMKQYQQICEPFSNVKLTLYMNGEQIANWERQ